MKSGICLAAHTAVLAAALIAMHPAAASAHAGERDPTFGSAGKAQIDFGENSDYGQAPPSIRPARSSPPVFSVYIPGPTRTAPAHTRTHTRPAAISFPPR